MGCLGSPDRSRPHDPTAGGRGRDHDCGDATGVARPPAPARHRRRIGPAHRAARRGIDQRQPRDLVPHRRHGPGRAPRRRLLLPPPAGRRCRAHRRRVRAVRPGLASRSGDVGGAPSGLPAHRAVLVRHGAGHDHHAARLPRRHRARRAPPRRCSCRPDDRCHRGSAGVLAGPGAVHRALEPMGRHLRVLLLHRPVLGHHVRATSLASGRSILRLLRRAVPCRVRPAGSHRARGDGGVARAPVPARAPGRHSALVVVRGRHHGADVAATGHRSAPSRAGQPAHPVAPLHVQHRTGRHGAHVRGHRHGTQGVRRRDRPARPVDPRRLPPTRLSPERARLARRSGGDHARGHDAAADAADRRRRRRRP